MQSNYVSMVQTIIRHFFYAKTKIFINKDKKNKKNYIMNIHCGAKIKKKLTSHAMTQTTILSLVKTYKMIHLG